MMKAASLPMPSIRKRHELFLWFHARGLNIDEDDEERSIWHPWKELVEYWRSERN